MRRVMTTLVLLCAVMVLWGCGETSPEEQVAQTRARYAARLNSFSVRDVPVEVEPMVEPAEGDEPADEPMDDEADPSEEEMIAPVTRQEVMLDILVQHDAAKALPGITVDITMADADKNEKGSWKLWVDTEGLLKANQKPVTHVLEDVGYEEGDGFSVEVRHPIPVEERGEYREFSEAGG